MNAYARKNADNQTPGVGFEDSVSAMIDVRSLFSDFKRFQRSFFVVFILAFLAIFMPAITQTPKYTATSTIMIDPRSVNSAPGQDVLSDLPSDTATIDTEVQVLQSSTIAESVMNNLHLDVDPEFNRSLAHPAFKQVLLTAVTRYLPKNDFGLALKSPNVGVAPQGLDRRQAIIRKILSGVAIKRSGVTRIIAISYTSTSAEKSKRIANEWARSYIAQQLDAKYQATKQANDWLNGKLTELKAQAETAETAVQQYKITNNLMNASGDSTIAATEITGLDQQLQSAKAEQAETDARLSVAREQMANGSNGGDVGAALNSDVIKNLREQRATLSQHIAELTTKYGPKFPEVAKAQHQLQDIDAQIQAEIGRIISNLQAESLVQQKRIQSLSGSVSHARGDLVGNNQALVKLNDLQRNADAITTLYKSYLDRFQQTTAQTTLGRTDARMVSAAMLPQTPSSPVPMMAYVTAGAGGLAAAVLSVLIRRGLDAGLLTGEDVEKYLGQPYLGGIADLVTTPGKKVKSSTPTSFIGANPISVYAESFRNLKASLIYSKLGAEVKLVAVTSALPGEGKTTTSICLAQTAALGGQSVLLIDCDIRRKSVSTSLGSAQEYGLIEVLSGTVKLADAIVYDEIHGLSYLPLSKSEFTPKDVFGSRAFDELLAHLRGQYDLVVLDTPPILPLVDTRILARKVDAVALLVRWGKTPRALVMAAIDNLESVGVDISGVALTQINMKEQARYGYGDARNYYGTYKKYYGN